MTTLTPCDYCGRIQEYDENLDLNCQHCGEQIMLHDDENELLDSFQ